MTHVFLDLDGTLTDPKEGITAAVIYGLEQVGLTAPPASELDWVIGPPLRQTFAKLGAPDPETALAHYRADYTRNGLFKATVYDGIPAALDGLAANGHQLYLMTAKPHEYARKITAQFGLDQHMRAQYGPELDGTRDDKAELLAYALNELGLNPADCVMVGDRDNDARAARRNNMRFVAAMWGYGSRDELAGADIFCAAPLDLVPEISAM